MAWILSTGSGLVSGLSRGRYQRGSRCGLVPKVIPSLNELLSGSARIEGVRDPRINDVLGRPPMETYLAAIARHFAGGGSWSPGLTAP